MRIAMITNNYKPFVGGVPIAVERQARALRKRGNEVTIFAPEYPSGIRETEDREEQVVRCKVGRKTMINGMVYPRMINREVLREFRDRPFDCVHVHQPVYAGNVGLYLGKKYDIPVIYTYHTRYEDYLHYVRFLRGKVLAREAKERVVPWYMRHFVNCCDMVLAPTPGMKQRIESQGARVPVEVMPTGLEEEFFCRDDAGSAGVRRTWARGKEYLFVTVSRLEEEKNLLFLLEGVRKLKEQGGGPFRLLVIGEGSMEEKLRDRLRAWQMEDCVTLLGEVQNQSVKTYLCAADLFLFTSKSETQGIVIQEALACGCPVVAVRASGVEDAVDNGENGYLTEENTEEWCRAVRRALEEPGRDRMRRAAEKSAEKYRISALAARQEALYRSCVERRWMEERAHERSRSSEAFSRLFRIS